MRYGKCFFKFRIVGFQRFNVLWHDDVRVYVNRLAADKAGAERRAQ